MSYLTEKMGSTPFTPIQHLRLMASSLEDFWGPVCAQFGNDRYKEPGPDDPFMKSARGDAKCLLMIADLLEKNDGS